MGNVIAHCCAFDKSGKQLIVGCSDGDIKTVNLDTYQVSGQFKAHDNSVNDLVINQDNDTVYSTGNDGTVRAWK